MNEDNSLVEDKTTLPPVDNTALPTDENLPESPPENESSESSVEIKSFTQEELDKIISKRLAREKRKWETDQQVQPRDEPVVQLDPSKFTNDDDYANAVIEQKVNERFKQREAQRAQQEQLSKYQEREEIARDKYDDFDQVVYRDSLPITDEMAELIKVSDIGPDLAYWLGQNEAEAKRISRLSPLVQAKEIGKIEITLGFKPVVVKKVSKVPEPIVPLTSRSTSTFKFDTTDPRSTSTMSTSEWIEAENRREAKKYQS